MIEELAKEELPFNNLLAIVNNSITEISKLTICEHLDET